VAGEHIRDLVLSALSLGTRTQATIDQWFKLHGQSAPPAARQLALLARGIARGISDQAGAFDRDLLDGFPPDRDSVVSLHVRALEALNLGTMLENSSQRSLHPVLSPAVQSQLELLGVAGLVLVSGTRDMSYELWSISRDDFSGLVSDDILNDLDWPLLVFLVPHPPLDWPLNHALVFHEMGHAVYRNASPSLGASVPSELQDHAGQTDLFERLELAKKRSLYLKMVASWSEELYADAVGLLMLGPSYLSAFCRVLGGFFSLDGASATHPPTALRIHLMGRIVRERQLFSGLPDRARRILQDWLDAAEAIVAAGFRIASGEAPLDAVLGHVVKAAVETHGSVLTSVEAALGPRCQGASERASTARRAELLYTFQIPSIEDKEVPTFEAPPTPLEPAQIFAAHWHAFYLALEAKQASADLLRSASEQGELMLGSLDAAESLRAWRKVE